MRILLLGAAGFIGTNLAIELSKNECNDITLVDRCDHYFSHINRLRLDNVGVKVSELSVDTNFDEVLEGQDVVYHLVSTTVPANSNKHISEELVSNIVLSSNVLDACVRCNVKKVVFISSGGAVYGKESTSPLSEIMPTNPISSYGIQKVAIENLLYLYRHVYGLDYRVVRLSNPYGPYQRPDGLLGAVSTFTYKALRNEVITVYGDGEVVRDFLFIDDAIKAIMKIASEESEYRTFNVGCGYGTSINDVIKTISTVLKTDLKVIYKEGRKSDVPVNYLNIKRYETLYGPLATVSLEEGIRQTAAFMKEYYCIDFVQ